MDLFPNMLLRDFATFLVILIPAAMAAMQTMHRDEEKTANFDVKPGAGSQQFMQTLDGVECTFSYRAQGGTKEEWVMSLFRDSSKSEWLCVVERPSGHSYLFFEQFKLTVSGANLKETLLERQPGVPLHSGEYMVITDHNYVQQWDGKFNSQLTKVQIYAVKSAGKEL